MNPLALLYSSHPAFKDPENNLIGIYEICWYVASSCKSIYSSS